MRAFLSFAQLLCSSLIPQIVQKGTQQLNTALKTKVFKTVYIDVFIYCRAKSFEKMDFLFKTIYFWVHPLFVLCVFINICKMLNFQINKILHCLLKIFVKHGILLQVFFVQLQTVPSTVYINYFSWKLITKFFSLLKLYQRSTQNFNLF